jgi:3-hydroxyisobutyrate dehydrogenase
MNSDNTKSRVAFLGLGIMGAGMARRLLGAGFPLTVYNRDAAKSAPFAADGARVAATPREAAEGAAIVICMVADDEVSRKVWLGENGALAGATPGTIIVDCSTLTVEWVQELAAAAKARGCEMLDAPVTGSKPQAAGGELTFLVGGTEANLEKARPALSVMSKAIVPLGPVGSGAMMKLVNNFICGVQTVALAEGLALIERSGLDRARALEILVNGAPGSPLFKNFSTRMVARDYTPIFKLALMAKDLNYAQHEAGLRKMELTTVKAALELFNKSISAGNGEKDLTSVIEQFRSPQNEN